MASIRGFLIASLTLTSSIGAAFASFVTAIEDGYVTLQRTLFDPVLDTWGEIVNWVVSVSKFTWKPDAHASLALDRLGHGTATAHDLTVALRFKAFIERARLALRFDGDGFMHGRPNHLMC